MLNFRFVQPENADAPTVSTLSAIITDAMVPLPSNALLQITFTGSPLYSAGIFTFAALPIYPTISAYSPSDDVS